jgi:hypothetical protein
VFFRSLLAWLIIIDRQQDRKCPGVQATSFAAEYKKTNRKTLNFIKLLFTEKNHGYQ